MVRSLFSVAFLVVTAIVLTLTVAVAAPQPETLPSEVLSASVKQVLAGGGLQVEIDGERQSVWLYGAHVPDADGATAFLRQRALGRTVALQVMPQVTWQAPARAEAVVYPLELKRPELSLNVAVLLAGFGVATEPRLAGYSPIDLSGWASYSDEARSARRGLWLGKDNALISHLRVLRGEQEVDWQKLLQRLVDEEGAPEWVLDEALRDFITGAANTGP